MKKIVLFTFLAFATINVTSCNSDDDNSSEQANSSLVNEQVKSGYSGVFTAELKTIDTKFTRVLYAAEGSEKEGESDSVEQLIFNSTNPQGQAVRVKRFQLLTKNTGATTVEELQSDDPKMKQVLNGAKLFIEVPVDANGNLILDQAYVGNLGYTFNGGGDERHQLAADEVSNIQFKLHKLELPTFDSTNKPGDRAIKYEEGYISYEFTSKAKYQDSETVGDFNIKVDSKITVTQIRGAERADRAVSINPEIVANNIN